ncbi:MAG: permease-like cell division protein FtsX [Burkholderiales bacterium]
MNWLFSQLDTLRESFQRLLRRPFAAILNIMVIGIALSLPAGLYLALDNLQSVSRQLSADPQLSVFLALDASAEEVQAIESRLRALPEVGKWEYMSRDAALEKLKRSAGLADVLADVGQNPLPDAFVVTAKNNEPSTLESLHDQIAGWPKVDHVQLDAEWARRLNAGLAVGRVLAGLLASLLSVALIVVTFNTIRLQILTRREEIEVAKLIGATHSFIRRPFLYHGTLQGLAGGLAAWAIVSLGVLILNAQLAELASLYGTVFRLESLTLVQAAQLLAFSSGLGWLGSWLSVSRHLWRIEPR